MVKETPTGADPKEMLLAQLSDLHITSPETDLGRVLDPVGRLHSAIDELNALDRRPDVLIITGDLVDVGTADEYRVLRAELERCLFPWYVVPGNHDEADEFAAAFDDFSWLPRSAPFQWVVEDHPVRLIGLDTTWADRHDGALDDERLQWLADTLAAQPDRPTVVALHHPPMETGMWWMDYGGLDGGDELRRIVEANPQVVRVISGHVHRNVSTNWGSTVVSACGSLVFQSGLGLAEDSVARLHDTRLTAPLFSWDGSDLMAFQLELEPPRLSVDLEDLIDDWSGYVASARNGGPVPRQ